MHILENVSLKLYSTMRLGGTTRYACEITSEDELLEALAFAHSNQLTYRVIGSGSNIVWSDEGYQGLLIINKIESFDVLTDGLSVTIGAGTNWDAAVEKSVEIGLSGIEFLSLIPGTAGATPVQNVGAYGREIKDIFTSLRAYDTRKKDFVELHNEDCQFGYRTSRFKTHDAGRFIITSITLKLTGHPPEPPFYESLQKFLIEHGVVDFTSQSIRDAVLAIRRGRMPDPAKVANNGSFFANPIVSAIQFTELQSNFPTIVGWPVKDGVKLAAGWLVEHAGFSDYHDAETGMATWSAQNLVLINEHATTTAELLKFKQKIVSAVQEKFAVTLEQEPELLP